MSLPESPRTARFGLDDLRLRATEYRPYLDALLIFLSSRVLVLMGIFFAARFVPRNPAGEIWDVNSSWYHYLLRYDSGWYMRIARFGYSFSGDNSIQQPVAFFPLYPLLTRAVSKLSGVDYAVAALLVANVAGVCAILLFYKLVENSQDRQVALYAVAFVSFFPTSLFLSAGYSESLALLLICVVFLLLKSQRFILAAVCAGLANATRPTSIVILVPLLWELWLYCAKNWKRFLALSVPCCLLATSGLWLYMIYLWSAFNHPFAFVTNVEAWSQIDSPLGIVGMLLLKPFAALTDIFSAGPNPNTLDPWIFLLFVALTIVFWRRLRTSHALFAISSLAFIYFTRTGTVGFMAATRYLLLVFPAFIILADLTRSKTWLALSIVGLFAGALFMYSAMFAQWYWAG
jgi:Gpi18-like mannosyltransferase